MKNLFILLVLVFTIGCADDAQKTNVAKKPNIIQPQKTKSNIVSYVPNKYIEKLAKELNLPLKTQRLLLPIEKKYNNIKSRMNKNKTWSGDTNKNSRLQYLKQKNSEYRAVLGNQLFQKKLAFDKRNR